MSKKSLEEQAGMHDVYGTCRFCSQMRAVWVKKPEEYSQDDIDRIATSECECPGALKEGKKQQLMNSGAEAIRMTLTDKHRKGAAAVMMAGLADLCAQRLRKVSVQIDRETTASMYLAKVEVEGGGKDIRVIVECKTTTVEFSDGEQGPDDE